MRSVSRRRPADFVRASLSEARVARMWSSVAARSSGAVGSVGARPVARLRRWQGASAVAMLVAVAAIVVGIWKRPAPRPTVAGLVIDTGSASQELSLGEAHAVVHLAPATRLRVLTSTAEETRLRLDSGSVVCDVEHREDRRFVVEAGTIEVDDRGTRFSVEVRATADAPEESAVLVNVERGAVEVHDAHDGGRTMLAKLGAGQAWKTAAPDLVPPPKTRTASSEPSPETSPTAEPIPSTSARANAASPPAPSNAGRSEALFARADAARLAGHHAEAAAELERFLRRFPNDARAGLAAYELGRIRLGSLHDPRGAAEAFGAVLERPDEPFRQEAEAGRVEALADLGDQEACKRMRDAFRAHYPDSPHTARVAKLCGR